MHLFCLFSLVGQWALFARFWWEVIAEMLLVCRGQGNLEHSGKRCLCNIHHKNRLTINSNLSYFNIVCDFPNYQSIGLTITATGGCYQRYLGVAAYTLLFLLLFCFKAASSASNRSALRWAAVSLAEGTELEDGVVVEAV